jgi:hypothetical protein
MDGEFSAAHVEVLASALALHFGPHLTALAKVWKRPEDDHLFVKIDHWQPKDGLADAIAYGKAPYDRRQFKPKRSPTMCKCWLMIRHSIWI